MMCKIQILSAKDLRQDLLTEISSEDTNATIRPRSMSKLHDEPSIETPRSRTESTYSQESDDAARQEEEYYAFLREMAGSFDNSYDSEDEESESGSENEAGNEDDGKQPNTTSGLSSPRRSAGPKHQGGSCTGAKGEANKETPNSRSASSSSNESTRPSEGDSYGFDDVSEADDSDDRRYGSPDPSEDFRNPVEDDYDVVQATLQFEDEHPRDRYLRQREDLRHGISIRISQANALAAPAENPLIGVKLQAHYGKVRQALLAEAQELEAQLEQFDSEEAHNVQVQ